MHVCLPTIAAIKLFQIKQNLKKDKKRFKMYEFDFVIINHKHITSSCLRTKKTTYYSKEQDAFLDGPSKIGISA